MRRISDLPPVELHTPAARTDPLLNNQVARKPQ